MRVRVPVEMAERANDEIVGTQRPFFEATDVHATPSAAWSRVGTGQRPVIDDLTVLDEEVIEGYTQVRNVCINPRANSVMARRPTAGGAPLALIEPSGENKAATREGS